MGVMQQNHFMKYILLFLLFLNTFLYSETTHISFLNYKISIPEDFILENINNSDLLLLKTKNNEIYSFIINKNNINIKDFTKDVLHKINSAEFIAENGFHLIQQKENKIYPQLKYVGCLEKRFNKCFEILNYYYNTIDLLFDIVLTKSLTISELRNNIISILQNQSFKTKSNDIKDMERYLFFRIRLKVFENQNKDFFIFAVLIPKENYYKKEYLIQQFLSSTNILSKNTDLLYQEEYFDINYKINFSNFLFVIDNSGSMIEEQNSVKNNLLRFINKLSLLSNDFLLGVITTDSCSLRNSFTNKKDQFEKNILVGTDGNATESCVYYAEKFLTDPDCNNNSIPENLSIICITDESDAYYSLANKPFNKNNNIFISMNIPFYAIMPLNSYGNPGDCSGPNGITDYTGNYGNETNTQKYAVNLKLLAEKTGGAVSSICTEEYGSFLEELAYASSAKHSRIKLSRIPVSNTIKVYLNQIPISNLEGNDYNPDKTYFIYSEEENSIILVGKNIKGRLKVSYLTFDY
ncbi:MAG: hypothetical protein KatS3mg129_2796 [Leptospiraceae bacterium]|nr:MAG: hypothetical protein KatS3mg129_2796 [Leptospiraceae bacterium]